MLIHVNYRIVGNKVITNKTRRQTSV